MRLQIPGFELVQAALGRQYRQRVRRAKRERKARNYRKVGLNGERAIARRLGRTQHAG